MDIISDVNLEKFPAAVNFRAIVPCNNPYLAAIGDICKLYMWGKVRAFFSFCSEHYEQVFYVLGNHEFYVRYNQDDLRIDALRATVREVLNIFPNVHVLDDTGYILGKTLIYGSTLWSRVFNNYNVKRKPMHYTSERNGLSVAEWNRRHLTALQGIQRAVRFARHCGYELVLLTHYAPTFKGTVETKYNNDSSNCMYCTELSVMFTIDVIRVWAFGHTGYNCDYYAHGTRVVSNQYYVDCDRSPAFDPHKYIEIKG
jgi:hypothetical protein